MNTTQGIRNIAVLGAGSWGTAAATLLCRNNHNVTLWSRETEKIAVVAKELENKEYLPGVKLDRRMKFTDDISCVKDKDLVVMVTPSASIRSMARKISGLIDKDAVIDGSFKVKILDEESCINTTILPLSLVCFFILFINVIYSLL